MSFFYYLCTTIRNQQIVMNALQLNAEMLRSLSVIAEDETLLRRAVKYLHKLVAEKKADSTEMTREEFFRRVDEGREQIRRGECIRFSDRDEMNKWLNSL